MVEVIKSIWLNILDPTNTKLSQLAQLEESYRGVVNKLEDAIEYWDEFANDTPMTVFNIQSKCYNGLMESGLQSQLVVDAVKDAYAKREKYCSRIRHPTIPFNVPRSGNLGVTDRNNPVIFIAVNKQRLGLPIKQDGAWARFNSLKTEGYGFTQFKLKRRDSRWFIIVTLKKDCPLRDRDNLVGVDAGNSVLASITVMGNGRIAKQIYLGQDLRGKQRDYGIRRSKLQSYADRGSSKARRKLRILKRQEHNYTTTRCYQVAHQIVDIARQYFATIVIEDLTYLNESDLSTKVNRHVKRMPYLELRNALETVAHQNGVVVDTVNPAHTSQTCSRCGNVSKSARKGSMYRCTVCDFICNADRNASVNIAAKLSLEKDKTIATNFVFSQYSNDKGSVNSLAWNYEGHLRSGSQPAHPPEFKPTPVTGG